MTYQRRGSRAHGYFFLKTKIGSYLCVPVSPPYTAVTVVVPAFRVVVIKLAEPTLSTPVPSTVLRFINETGGLAGSH